MFNWIKIHITISFATWLIFGPVNTDSTFGETRLSQRIAADWQKRRLAFSSAKYSLEGEILYPKKSMEPIVGELDGVVAEDRIVETQQNYLIDFQHSRIRGQLIEPIPRADAFGFTKTDVTWLYDGEIFRRIRPPELNEGAYGIKENTPRYHVDRKRKTDGSWRMDSLYNRPIWLAHGVADHAVLIVDSLRTPLDPSRLEVSAPPPDNDAEALALVRIDGRFPQQLLVDLSKQSAVLQYEMWNENRVDKKLEIEYEPVDGQWMPIRWTGTQFGATGNVYSSVNMEVVNFTANPTVEEKTFTISPKPGDVIRTDDMRHFRVGDEGEWNEFDPRVPPADTSSLSWAFWAVVVAVACAIVGLVVRSRKET